MLRDAAAFGVASSHAGGQGMARESSPSREMQHDAICDEPRFAIAISRDRTLRAEPRRDGVGTERHRNGLLGRLLLVDAPNLIPSGCDVARAA